MEKENKLNNIIKRDCNTKINILHGDDEEKWRNRIKILELEDTKYKITQVDNIEDLIKEGEKREYDLIITDGLYTQDKPKGHQAPFIVFYEKTGLYATKKLREKGIDTSIIMYSSIINHFDYVIEILQQGIQYYIRKTENKDEDLKNLGKAIKNLLYKK